MNTIKLVDFGTDLSSRSLGSRIRNDIIQKSNDGTVCIDFTGVLCVADSFLDECIAVLAAHKGPEWFKEKIKVIGMDDIIREDLLAVMGRRLLN